MWYAAGSVAAAVALLLGVSLLLEEKGSLEPARVERVAMAGMEPEKAEVVALAGGRLEFPAMELESMFVQRVHGSLSRHYHIFRNP